MPNAKILEQKKQIVEDLANKMKNASSGVLVDYKGITVDADTKLRRELRQAGVEYAVVKNTLLRFAAEKIGFDGINEHLNGTTALAVSMTDPVIPAKILQAFAKKDKNLKKDKYFTIKVGFLGGSVINAEEVTTLAELPAKEVIISRVLGSLNAPITSFVSVLNANIRGLAVVLNAIAEQKGA